MNIKTILKIIDFPWTFKMFSVSMFCHLFCLRQRPICHHFNHLGIITLIFRPPLIIQLNIDHIRALTSDILLSDVLSSNRYFKFYFNFCSMNIVLILRKLKMKLFITKYIIIVDLKNTGEQKEKQIKFYSQISTVKCI